MKNETKGGTVRSSAGGSALLVFGLDGQKRSNNKKREKIRKKEITQDFERLCGKSMKNLTISDFDFS